MRDSRDLLLEKTTFCTGLWLVKDNSKWQFEHYLNRIHELCNIISGGKLVLFHDDLGILKLFKDACDRFEVNLVDCRISLTQLPTYEESKLMLERCRAMNLDSLCDNQRDLVGSDKGSTHYWRDYKQSGEAAYRSLVTIWTSKIYLIHDITFRNNPFETDQFCWIDSSVSRFKHTRTNWNIRKMRCPDRAIAHYGSPMRYFGRPLPINASVLLGNREAWGDLRHVFGKAFQECLREDYAHDEETILCRCYDRCPRLFHKLGRPYEPLEIRMFSLAAGVKRRFSKIVFAILKNS